MTPGSQSCSEKPTPAGSPEASGLPGFDDVIQARDRIARMVHRTPVLTCRSIDRMAGASLYFKCENFQRVGAFKFRGAANAVFSLRDEEAARGVATHSSGNHAAAVALAARLRGITAHVVMPDNAPRVKKQAVAGYGARITFCTPTLEARGETLARVLKKTGATFIHPYDDSRIIAGQGTAGLELEEQTDGLDYAIAPVGGGGLLSGVAIALAGKSPRTQILGAEPAHADDARRSLLEGRIVPAGNPRTIADGLLTSLGEKTFRIVRRHVAEIVTAEEQQIIDAMRTVWERMKIVIEPSAAVPLAAVLAQPDRFADKRIGIVVSGGNVDLEKLPWNAGNR